MVYKRVCRKCPLSSCGAKYLVRLANHLAGVHQLDHIQQRQYLQEAKLQPNVKVVVCESEADNSGKNHSTSTRNPVQKQETVYELSRSRRNEAGPLAPKAWLNQGASLVEPTRLFWLSNQAYQTLPYAQKAWLTRVFLVSLVSLVIIRTRKTGL